MCVGTHMEPLQLNSKAEETHFFDLIQNNPKVPENLFHIGGLLVNDQWKWKSDSKNIYSNMKWAPGEPNNAFGGENCLCIWKYNNIESTGFNDVRCDNDQRYFFCQISDPRYT